MANINQEQHSIKNMKSKENGNRVRTKLVGIINTILQAATLSMMRELVTMENADKKRKRQ